MRRTIRRLVRYVRCEGGIDSGCIRVSVMSLTKQRFHGWSCDKNLWDELERLGKSLSWTKVPSDQNASHRVPDGIGVYLICASPPADSVKKLKAYTVLYAGQVKSPSRGLRTRFLEHINQPTELIQLFRNCYYPNFDFWFSAVKDSSRINELENILIETFKPPCNIKRAPGSSILLARLGVGERIGTNIQPQSE